jgi:hypothetical protein
MSIYAFEGAFLDARQFAMDLNGDSLPLFRQPNNERPAVLRIGLARNVLPLGQPVKNAGERGASMRQRSMQFSDARVARSGQMGKYVPFPLRNPETIQEDTNAVRGAMDFRNKAKRLSQHGNSHEMILSPLRYRKSTSGSRQRAKIRIQPVVSRCITSKADLRVVILEQPRIEEMRMGSRESVEVRCGWRKVRGKPDQVHPSDGDGMVIPGGGSVMPREGLNSLHHARESLFLRKMT